jgi:hypothetical protein
MDWLYHFYRRREVRRYFLSGSKRWLTSCLGAVDAGLLSTFNLMEQYASAAYCKSNYDSPGDGIKCRSGTCPLVEAANASSVIEYAR